MTKCKCNITATRRPVKPVDTGWIRGFLGNISGHLDQSWCPHPRRPWGIYFGILISMSDKPSSTQALIQTLLDSQQPDCFPWQGLIPVPEPQNRTVTTHVQQPTPTTLFIYCHKESYNTASPVLASDSNPGRETLLSQTQQPGSGLNQDPHPLTGILPDEPARQHAA